MPLQLDHQTIEAAQQPANHVWSRGRKQSRTAYQFIEFAGTFLESALYSSSGCGVLSTDIRYTSLSSPVVPIRAAPSCSETGEIQRFGEQGPENIDSELSQNFSKRTIINSLRSQALIISQQVRKIGTASRKCNEDKPICIAISDFEGNEKHVSVQNRRISLNMLLFSYNLMTGFTYPIYESFNGTFYGQILDSKCPT